jgi:hypothetical protein
VLLARSIPYSVQQRSTVHPCEQLYVVGIEFFLLSLSGLIGLRFRTCRRGLVSNRKALNELLEGVPAGRVAHRTARWRPANAFEDFSV